MSKLETILQEEVEAELRAILEEAEAKAKALLEEAQAKAQALLEGRRRALEASHKAALKRAESAGELLLSTARAQAKGQVLEEVKAQALAALEGLRAKPEWPGILRRLAEEALAGLAQPEALLAHPEDLPHLEALARERGLALRPDPGLRLGVRAVGQGGRNQVENALPARLERAWDGLSARVAQALWG